MDLSLADFAGLSRCISRKCGAPPCDPPEYDDPCCLRFDYDNDGDVDLDDHGAMLSGFMGP